MIKQKLSLPKLVTTVLLAILAFTMILPFLWMISTSFKLESDVFKFPVEWIPSRWHAMENYREVWGSQYNFGLYYWNTVKVTIVTTIVQVLISAMAAYAFSKINFKYRNLVFLGYLATAMIPDQVTIVPKFMLFRWFQLFDTHGGLIILNAFSVYGVFLLRQHMVTVPGVLSESAKIDGANHITIFSRIILPIVKPSIVTLAILKFVWTWNDYQNPLIFLKSRDLFTIQLAMQQFMTDYASYFSLIMTAAVSAIVPLIIVFLIGQRFVVEGITVGAVKG
ncbi:carbohydrate ABC transporter membrane protein 2 (CUT1 family) [Hydrogenispora ethanolica]|jgi:multiple sugar transport system permease protein|uniref:Carbohydrate ABC transporter membrane protein 2 (CUT1 family) n=1 Tax=Hydrogenispora ethanolica TaxID=1082276 RepID=A0A4R1R9D9_HYDET|nr:carbohydrate ABC transporter permease [Hydrogenispora ethanolica]TCL62278.1 carbohydrate ABC transporter membrane protein 2 (CUT1 family) [Hydrogenispora ethanolica]